MRLTRSILSLLAALLLTVCTTAVAQEYDRTAEKRIIDLVNQERQKRDLPPLVVDEQLTNAARRHSVLMAEKDDLSHQFSGEAILPKRLAAAGARFDFSGENVGMAPDVTRVHEGFMKSTMHRANILHPDFNRIGIGVVRQGTHIWVTQDFSHGVKEVSADTAEHWIADQLQDIQLQGGFRAIPVVDRPELNSMACRMANNDRVSADVIRNIPKATRVAVFAEPDISRKLSVLDKLQSSSASSFAVGICYASSRTYDAPVYWGIVVAYN